MTNDQTPNQRGSDPNQYSKESTARAPREAGAPPPQGKESSLQRVLNGVERVGNKVPHPIVIFVLLIAGVILLSHLFYLLGTSVTYERINTETHQLEQLTRGMESAPCTRAWFRIS